MPAKQTIVKVTSTKRKELRKVKVQTKEEIPIDVLLVGGLCNGETY